MQCEKRVNSTSRLHSQQEDRVCCLRKNLQYQQCDICRANGESVQYQEGRI